MPTLTTEGPAETMDEIAKTAGGLMAEIINLVSNWANLAHRVNATPDQIGGQRFIRLTFYSQDNNAIAAANISADAPPEKIGSILASVGLDTGQFVASSPPRSCSNPSVAGKFIPSSLRPSQLKQVPVSHLARFGHEVGRGSAIRRARPPRR
jgi:hypothetical protein